jgi:hypothetical protein
MSDYSYEDLQEFLQYAGEKGLVKENTARTWRSATKKVFSVLDEEERNDVRKIDLQSAFQRFVNKSGTDYAPSSLKAYRSRTKTAVESFLEWKQDPSAWSWNGRQSSRRQDSDTSQGSPSSSPAPAESAQDGGQDESELRVPFPLRGGDVVAQVVVPRDITADEARNLARFIESLRPDGDE